MRWFASLLVLCSCARSSAPEPVPTVPDATAPEPTRTMLCFSKDGPLQGLKLARPLDSLVLTSLVSFEDLPPDTVIDVIGEPCKTAVDVDGCRALAMHFTTSVTFFNPQGIQSLVGTIRDDVIAYAHPEDFLSWLGDVDTPQEALLLLRLSGRVIACDVDPTVATVSGGYRLVTRREGCIENVVVTTDGRIVLERARIDGIPTFECPAAPDAGPTLDADHGPPDVEAVDAALDGASEAADGDLGG